MTPATAEERQTPDNRLPDDRPTVLFVCTHNSARSQLAEALLRHRHGDRWRALSAGTEARGVHPLAVRALAEAGVPTARLASKTVASLGEGPFEVVVTVCDGAREACPFVPAQRRLHHGVADPSAVDGTEADRLDAFRATRDALADWLDAMFGPDVPPLP